MGGETSQHNLPNSSVLYVCDMFAGGKADTIEKFAALMQEGFEMMEKRFEQVDQRFEKIEGRLTAVESRLASLEERIAAIEKHVGIKF